MSTAIRKVTVRDCSRLSGIHRDCFADFWSAESFRGLICSPGVFGFFGKHSAAGEWQSFVLARVVADAGEILTLGTLPAARRTGLGSRVLTAAMHEAAKRGALQLVLEVDESNEAALHLYDVAGFSEIGRRYGYYLAQSGMRTDALMLAVKLPSGP